MASITSQNASPHSGASPYDFESNNDSEESWQYLDYNSVGSGPASVGFLSSPASGSLSGFAIVGHGHGSAPSPNELSPSHSGVVDLDQGLFLPSSSSFQPETEFLSADAFLGIGSAGSAGLGLVEGSQSPAFLTPQQYLLAEPDGSGLSAQDLQDLAPFMNEFHLDSLANAGRADAISQQLTQQPQPQQQQHNNLPLFPSETDLSTWSPTYPNEFMDHNFVFEDMNSPIAKSSSASSSMSSPKSPAVKSETSEKSVSSISRKVIKGKVEKTKSEPKSQFVIVTPNTINARAGKPNPFECFEAMRTTQKGRKGPLANKTKESALQVRRVGACFCCHSRKVKCDLERPCKHCKKLMLQVPQVVCWQFQDFLPVLFPEFIRGHFKKDEMAKFMTENIEGFAIDGVDQQQCEVELSSGPRFSTTLTVKAKFFKPKTCEVLQHWHLSSGNDKMNLHANSSAPIGVEMNKGARKDELKKLAKAYIRKLTSEPLYAEQVTDSFRSTRLPAKILSIIQRYAKQSEAAAVERALSIYTMHYVMTRHLCLTQESILRLSPSGQVPQNVAWVTPRVLARQIKSIIDELILREMQQLFELFSKCLKPKMRREWAPCLAAFLVLCLFMEAVETAADNFVVSQNEINLRHKHAMEYRSSLALDTCKEIENLPFKQFAYQFHNLFQTHSKDANTKSFNPLFDYSLEELGESDKPAIELVQQLRELFQGEDWQDMQFLADDEMILRRDEHPFPMDTSFLYTGRLVAKFLLSFTNESYIFGGKI